MPRRDSLCTSTPGPRQHTPLRPSLERDRPKGRPQTTGGRSRAHGSPRGWAVLFGKRRFATFAGTVSPPRWDLVGLARG